MGREKLWRGGLAGQSDREVGSLDSLSAIDIEGLRQTEDTD